VLYAESLPLADSEFLIPVSDKIPYTEGTISYSYQLENLKRGHYFVRAYNQAGYGSRHNELEY
jgi:hypothetical protein